MIGVIRLSAGESTHKYRLMLQQAQSESRAAPGRLGFEGSRSDGVRAPLLSAAEDNGRMGGTPVRGDDSALRNRREALGSTAYR